MDVYTSLYMSLILFYISYIYRGKETESYGQTLTLKRTNTSKTIMTINKLYNICGVFLLFSLFNHVIRIAFLSPPFPFFSSRFLPFSLTFNQIDLIHS